MLICTMYTSIPRSSSTPYPPLSSASSVQMGVGVARCVSGCTCQALEFDGHHSKHESQTFLASLTASQHPKCTIQVGSGPGG